MSLRADPLDLRPERPELLAIVIKGVIGTGELAETVDQRAAESERIDATIELARGSFRILHRQRRKPLEAIRPPCDLLGEKIVGSARQLQRAIAIGNRLHSRRVERQQHQLDAVGIHLS